MDRQKTNEPNAKNEIAEHDLKAALAELYAGPATPEAPAEERLWTRIADKVSAKDEQRARAVAATTRKPAVPTPWRWAAVAAFIGLGLLATAIFSSRQPDTWSAERATRVATLERAPDQQAENPRDLTPKQIEEILAPKSGLYATERIGDNSISPMPGVEAVIGDHHETINPDRPDTRSSFGTPEGLPYFWHKGDDSPAGGGGTGGVNLKDNFEAHESFNKRTKNSDLEDTLGVGGFGARDDSSMGRPRNSGAKRPTPPNRETTPATEAKALPGDPVASTYGDKAMAAAKEDKYGPNPAKIGERGKYADGVTPKDKPVLAPPPLDPYANLPEINPNVKVLKGGTQDDNAQFAEFLDFLQRTNAPGAIKADVSERVVIDLTDKDGYPLSNADVRVYHDGKCVHKVRTLADGRALFHPRAAGVDPQAREFSVEVIAPPGCGEKQMDRARFTGRQGVWKLQAPYTRSQDPVKLDILFCLDCTGSMSDEIAQVQKTLMQMVAKFNALPGKPRTRWGLVQYRDRGDDYVTKVHDFTEDVAKFQKKLNACEAGGGGDEPESVNEALDKSVEGVDWDRGDAIRLVFLIGDAPPHMNYQNDVKYTESMQKAQRRAIKICPLASSGLDKTGELIFRQVAQYTLGRFLFISYGEGQNARTPHEVGQPNQSNNLDDLIVHVVANEVNARATKRPAQQEQPQQTDTWK